MLWNAETVIVGKRCCLVPYRKEHVVTYHEWMKDPDLLEATQSEPLSLQEEYDMQQSWLLDSKKCTFIILDKDKLTIPPSSSSSQSQQPQSQHTVHVADTNTNDAPTMVDPSTNFVYQNRSAMVGDVNLFFSDEEEEEEEDDDDDDDNNNHNQLQPNKTTSNCDSDNNTTIQYQQAELDIMIAVKDARQKGIGKEACLLMMLYITTRTTTTSIPLTFSIRRFFVKINQTNLSSIQLFTKLGFQLYQYIECFQQMEMEYKTNSTSTMIQQLQRIYHQKIIILPDSKQSTNLEKNNDDDDITTSNSSTTTTLVTFHCPAVVLEQE